MRKTRAGGKAWVSAGRYVPRMSQERKKSGNEMSGISV